MQILHTAFRDHWAEALETGAYTWSTRGRTLAEEGFLHASRPDQVEGVLERYYADVDRADLVLLVIDTDLLDVPWRNDPVGDDTYPHIYGPLSPSAVVGTRDLHL
ncbi:MAG: DUF952 domain-containing protein [Aeromicrobium sp.]|uniref:DUF952 domain-containing protein n=1 Tax=Aeromicrobium sp. TaxID=1871063 RepID=UPI002603CA52|nr:DUF952 domain-containing protein [Aeromicrobium sp.]MDF1705155.1 DUF952 domain-containing protein [Aeromicrobium sp.]